MRARSGTPASPLDDRRNDEARQHDGETHEADDDASGDCLRVIAQLELSRSGRYGDGQQRVISTEHPPGCPSTLTDQSRYQFSRSGHNWTPSAPDRA